MRQPAPVTNQRQLATLDALVSVIDEMEHTPESDGSVIFEGYSVDGLAVGSIQPDGTIDWCCGEIDVPMPCQGHPAGPNDPQGLTVYCDGTCRS